jgi:hypothetical protein
VQAAIGKGADGLDYRLFGNTTLDQTSEIVECSYGGAVGVASALARMTSQ